MYPPRRTTVTGAGGVTLAVVEQGDPQAPTIVLVHGYPDTHAVWDAVAEALAVDHHVVRYDIRGAGASDRPRARSAYRLPLLAADFEAVRDAVSPDRPVHLVAHDWGSIGSWESVTEPDATTRIASYTTISGPCLDHVGDWYRARLRRPTPRHLRQLIVQQVHSWYIVVFQLPFLAPLFWRLFGRRWGAILARTEKLRGVRPAPTISRDGAVGVRLYRANMGPRIFAPRRRPTAVPVQLIQLAGDKYVTGALLEGLEQWAPKLWRRTVHSGHWAPLSHPEVVSRMVREFVAFIDGGPEPRALVRARTNAGRFAHNLVVVTGAGSGIGRETVRAFLAAGAEVVSADLDLAAARDTGGFAHQLDVSDEAAVQAFAELVRTTYGVPDVVVNNAGVGHSGTLMNTTTAEMQRVLDVNLWGVIHGCRAFGAQMVARGEGGHIVNLASAAAFQPSKTLVAYSTSKAAVLMLSECLRAELAEFGIGVSAICPGFVATNITRTTVFAGVTAAEQQAKRDRTTALYKRRNYTPDRVAQEILRAVERDQAVVPVTVEAKVTHLLGRITPGVLRAAAKLDLT